MSFFRKQVEEVHSAETEVASHLYQWLVGDPEDQKTKVAFYELSRVGAQDTTFAAIAKKKEWLRNEMAKGGQTDNTTEFFTNTSGTQILKRTENADVLLKKLEDLETQLGALNS